MQRDRSVSESAKFRRTFLCLFGALLAAGLGLAAAAPRAPLTAVPVSEAFAALIDVDLLEATFREGTQFYDTGDYAAALRAWEGPAERGHTEAQFSMGVAYATGNGVAQDLTRAIGWWESAAAQGHVSAQLNLGLLYWRGEGVAKDVLKARSWWRRAADGGDPAAQFHLGALAATGEGVPIDYKEAARWWRLSAAQGYRQAIKGLEILKVHGVSLDDMH